MRPAGSAAERGCVRAAAQLASDIEGGPRAPRRSPAPACEGPRRQRLVPLPRLEASGRCAAAPPLAAKRSPAATPRTLTTACRVTLAASLLLASVSAAEAGWLGARGRLLPETRVEAFLGTRSFGAGLVRADTDDPRAGLTFEGLVGFLDRDVEVRGARLWQLTRTQFATASVSVGGAAFLVPDRAVDVGLGPHAQLALSLGGPVFSVELALQTGLEVFLRQPSLPRLPQRAVLGALLRVSEFTVSLAARAGADLVPGRTFIGRGEVMVSVGWLGLDPALGRPLRSPGT